MALGQHENGRRDGCGLAQARRNGGFALAGAAASWRPAWLWALVCAVAAAASPLAAQEHEHGEAHGHGHPGSGCAPHFVHPLFAESVSPDTKVRLDLVAATPDGERDVEAEGEYAMGCVFSAELGVHYHLEERELGDAHLMLKGANGRFARQGVSLGYGVSLGFPARSTAPEDHAGEAEHESSYHVAPFVNGGLETGRLELVGWAFYTVHTGSLLAERRGTSLDGSISGLLFVTPRLAGLLELLVSRGIGGEAEPEWHLSLAPGVRLESIGRIPGLAAGTGVELPFSARPGYDARFLASLFYHF